MGDDSCSKGRGFIFRRRILDGHFFTLICRGNCIVCLKRPKINEKDKYLATLSNCPLIIHVVFTKSQRNIWSSCRYQENQSR